MTSKLGFPLLRPLLLFGHLLGQHADAGHLLEFFLMLLQIVRQRRLGQVDRDRLALELLPIERGLRADFRN
jgi:hypothetical protein